MPVELPIPVLPNKSLSLFKSEKPNISSKLVPPEFETELVAAGEVEEVETGATGAREAARFSSISGEELRGCGLEKLPTGKEKATKPKTVITTTKPINIFL